MQEINPLENEQHSESPFFQQDPTLDEGALKSPEQMKEAHKYYLSQSEYIQDEYASIPYQSQSAFVSVQAHESLPLFEVRKNSDRANAN